MLNPWLLPSLLRAKVPDTIRLDREVRRVLFKTISPWSHLWRGSSAEEHCNASGALRYTGKLTKAFASRKGTPGPAGIPAVEESRVRPLDWRPEHGVRP